MLDLFDIQIKDKRLKSPIALASMAGITHAEYIKQRAKWVGFACMGGYSIDEKTIEASTALIKRGREEFLFSNQEEVLQAIEKEISELRELDVVVCINLRASSPSSLTTAAQRLGTDIVYEIDAHCRQEEMIQAGCGEYLLTHTDVLAQYIAALKAENAIVSVKIRAGVAEDDVKLAQLLWKAGADIIHVDCMDKGATEILKIRNACPLLIIGNNSINSFASAKAMLTNGADLISLARMAQPSVLSELYADLVAYAKEVGWYNVPKQLCRGGDIRALSFCCPPIKPCPLISYLQHLEITPQEFMNMKTAAAGLPLMRGEGTCFGSLVFCCKSSTPCFGRDRALHQISMSKATYMKEKRALAKKLLEMRFA
ncbi:MAG: methanogenesis marker 9 domain-containing protein [Methanomicrobiales archaeon]|nr:methanogenesis marker 9 domain-containing protein [Methanomicrobiales archaeon]